MSINSIKIIPQPVEIIEKDGNFEINSNTRIFYDENLESLAKYFANLLLNPLEITLKIENLSTIKDQELLSNCVILSIIDPNSLDKTIISEGYLLEVSNSRINLNAIDKQGIFYGIQTLRQLLPKELESPVKVEGIKWNIPAVEIFDYPRFGWRGFMLDEVRHFFGKTFVKRMIDLMALHKLNKLHWHITDDEGWRIESKKFPKLTEIGAKRPVSKKWGESPNLDDPKWYGGFHSIEDIKEIIEYAAQHFIEVIPEIEMPGHATAPLVSYPKFSCSKPAKVVSFIGEGKKRLAYCAGKPKTYDFLKQVLEEVTIMFPTNKIHIGGDELPKNRWEKCPDCQKFIQNSDDINDLDDLQVHFAAQFIKFLAEKGKTTIGWFDFDVDKLLKKDINTENLIFQFWVGSDDKVVSFIRKGGRAIISNHRYMYMDYTYTGTPLKKAYNFEPIPKQLEEKYHNQVLGVETPIWTERIPSWQKMDYRVFPRLSAHAEKAWSLKERRDYDSFIDRLKRLLKRFDIMNIFYAPLFEATNSLKARLLPRRRNL